MQTGEKTKPLQENGDEEREESLEEAFSRLEEIASRLEAKETSLEDSFLLYQEGVLLLRRCNDKLDTVEKKMLQISEEGILREFP